MMLKKDVYSTEHEYLVDLMLCCKIRMQYPKLCMFDTIICALTSNLILFKTKIVTLTLMLI